MPINIKRPEEVNPAVQSLKKFGGMIKENVLDRTTEALAYPGQVVAGTFNQAAKGVQNLPQTLKDFDQTQTEHFKQYPGPVVGTQKGIIGPEYPETRASIAESSTPLRDLPGGKLPEGNIDALMGVGQTVPPVNLKETGYDQPGYINPEGVKDIRTATDLAANQPEQDISSKIPGTDIATVEGWKSKQNVLPGNDFNKANTKDYFKQTGYIKDDDPRMIKRRQEAEDVQARRLKFIEDSEAGKFSSGSSPTIAGGLPVGGRGNGYTPVSNIGKKERIADTNARQRSQDNLARLASGNATQQETVGLPKSISRKDQVEGFNQAKAFGQEFTSKVVPGLPPIVGEEIFNLITPDMPLTRLQTVLDEELTKLKVDSKDADIVNDPAEIVSLLKNRIRNEQSR